ncbi:hypothetical protein [Neisseria dumasiana]|nr:hypothetical protein [Neisseria dumasiana]
MITRPIEQIINTTQTAAIPADWTENPLAAVVYEPVSESGAGHE